MQDRTLNRYTPELRETVLRRFFQSEASARALSDEYGIPHSTLNGWIKRHKNQVMSEDESPADGRATDDRSPAEKFQLVVEAAALKDEQLGAFLRTHGIREGDLERWKQDALDGMSKTPKAAVSRKELQKVKRQLEKTEKKLGAANALLELQKKVQALWGEEDDSTPHK